MELKNRIDEKIISLLNDRIKGEYYSAYLYYSISNWCDCYGFKKAKEKFRNYGDEELTHARKIEDFVNDKNGKVILQSIPKPPTEFKSLLDVVIKSYEHECTITDAYNKLSLALVDKCSVCFDFLIWFVNEQQEEEAKFGDIITIANSMGITDETKGIEIFKLEELISK